MSSARDSFASALPAQRLTPEIADGFAAVALSHVRREYPNKLDHVLTGDNDVLPPSVLHPVFYGSFDWHSCVHGYWLLARVLRRYPGGRHAQNIASLFDVQLTAAKVEGERAYAAHDARRGFERPYGWAWLLMLQSELLQHRTDAGRRWSAALAPLADVFVQRFGSFLPIADYPVRTGTHFNSAFAVVLALDYARTAGDEALEQLLVDTARRWYMGDKDCQGWEPGGDDFLSSALTEALCMRRVLGVDFADWFRGFLPRVGAGEPAALFMPAAVSDRSDGKIAHLDGLNLSRAWCWRAIAAALPAGDERSAAIRAAGLHISAGLPHVTGDYMGEHWLATFALLALDGDQ